MERNAAACAMDWSVELEKALRSKKPGRAIEALLQIGSRLPQWSREPEPKVAMYNIFDLVTWEDKLFANTILLRLADAFKSDDEHIRRSVVRVFLELYKCDKMRSKQYKGILSKANVQNHQELLTRVKVVFDGGDSESRALSLILFGCWTHFAKDSAHIRYLILSSLLSPHLLEVKASIFAATCISELADDFARVFLEILVNIMTSSTTLAIRMAGAQVFANFGCSHSVAIMAYKAGLELVLDSCEEDFLVAMLFSLSKLASNSIFISSEQVQFLCSLLCHKKSACVQKTSLRCLCFLFVKGSCQFSNIGCMVRVLVNALEEDMLPETLHCDVLRLLRKILSYVLPNLSFLDANEFSKLVTTIESASRSQIKSKSLLAIHVLVDLSLTLSGKMEIVSRGCSFSLLPLQVISLIMDQFASSGMTLVDLSQSKFEVFQEFKALQNLLLLIVTEHSDLWTSLVEKICLTVKSIMNIYENLWNIQQTDMEEDKKNDISLKFSFIIYGLVTICIDYLGQVAASEIFDKVKLLVTSVCQSNLFSYHTCIIYSLLLNCKFVLSSRKIEGLKISNIGRFPHITFREYVIENEIFTLEFAKRLLQEGNEWPAYKAATHAACHGSWFAATLIFEGKILFLLSTEYGSGIVNWLEKERFLNIFSIDEQTSHHHAGSFTEFIDCDKLLEAYQCLCSSVETLKAAVSSEQSFCFQRWFLSLRTKVIRIVGSIFKLLGNILHYCSSNCVELGSNDIFAIHETLEELSRLSLTLERSSREFDMIRTTFIGIDTKSSNVISALALNCSVMAFCTGFAFHFPNSSTTLTTENLEDFKKNLYPALIQNLIGRLWSVDHEMCMKLIQLFEVTGGPKNCSHFSSRSQILDLGYEVRDIITLCSYAVSEVFSIQSKANKLNEGTLFHVIKDGIQLLSNILMQWISIPFRTPKCFFCVRPCIGSELFATTDSHKPDGIFVQRGFHLSLNLCLQLRHFQPDMSVQITKLYCILCCGLSFKGPGPGEENKEQKQEGYEAWEDGDMVDMHNKLLCHVTECSKNEDSIGKCRTPSSGTSHGPVQVFVHFELNQKGQGFSNCLLDVSHLPVGCYRIKWYSCCFDREGSFWSLLPLNSGPLFSVHERPSVG